MHIHIYIDIYLYVYRYICIYIYMYVCICMKLNLPIKHLIEAIESLPSYVQRSHLFIVLAPACKHKDHGNFCDFGTWLSRGWCNVEFFCSSIPPTHQQQILIQSANDVFFIEPRKAFQYYPGKGNFAVEADRASVSKIAADVIDLKIQSLLHR